MTGCGAAQLEHAASFDFGDVALGQARTTTFQVTNSGARAASLTWSVSDEFSVEDSSTTLGAGDALTLRVHFTPADLGPRTGTLIIRHDAGASTVSLSGRGTGPRLSVAHEVTLGELAIIGGQPLPIVAVPLVVTNAGTAGSALHLEAPSPSGDEVCVGAFDGLGVCTPWTPPATLAAGEVVTLPVHVRPTSVGARTWSVTLASDDPLTRAQVVTLRAVVARYEPCLLSGPQQVLLGEAPVPVVITHRGAGTCLVRAVELASSPASAFLLTSPTLPARLDAGGTLTLSVAARASAPRTATGVLRVTPAAGPPHEVEVAVAFKPPEEACLTLVPALLDFGTVMTGCAGLVRHVQLYNTCATPLTLESISVTAAAGLGPGTAGCPGATPCPEFWLTSSPGLITLDPAQTALVSVRYAPLDLGVDQGAVSVVVRDGGAFVLALEGRGDLTAPQTDSFRDAPLPVADVLVMVDTSPSFAPQRAAVRANLASWLSQSTFRCLDLRWAFAPADGAPDAGVAFARNDAGSGWTSTLEPDFVARALSAFDALPGGSETEACIGPAAALMQTVAPRDAGTFGGLCITDALEQSPAPMAALAQLQARLPTSWTTWSVVAGFSPGCTVEAQDDGVHGALVQASNGARESVCTPSWWSTFTPLGLPTCGARSEYFLNSRPAPGTLEVRVDGVLVPASDWSYDAANNAVTFASGHAPRLGATITAHYRPACTP